MEKFFFKLLIYETTSSHYLLRDTYIYIPKGYIIEHNRATQNFVLSCTFSIDHTLFMNATGVSPSHLMLCYTNTLARKSRLYLDRPPKSVSNFRIPLLIQKALLRPF
jgi:hypothetical protein